MVEHANAYASLARGGSYKDIAYILEIKNSSGEVIESWTDSEAKRVVDEQVAYMISSILSDRTARYWNNEGFVVPDVWTATKTGTTTTTDASETKDSLMASYSTAISTFVWNGNHDGSGVSSNTHDVARFVTGDYMERVHKEVYEPDGKWHYGDQPAKPEGIQTLTVNGKTDIWPSWFNTNKNSGIAKETLTFNRYNHMLASECTPEEYKIEVEVTKVTDPMTGNDVYHVPEPYDREASDPCTYRSPSVSLSVSGQRIVAAISYGSENLNPASFNLQVTANGETKDYPGISIGSDGVISGYTLTGYESHIKLSITDNAGYTAVADITLTPKPKVEVHKIDKE